MLVAVGAHRQLSGTPVTNLGAGTELSGSDFYVSSSYRSGVCTLYVPGERPQSLYIERSRRLDYGTGAPLPGPFPTGTTLTCNEDAKLIQGAITRLYWIPEHGFLIFLLGATPCALGHVGLRVRRRNEEKKSRARRRNEQTKLRLRRRNEQEK
ncbi:hypothetical protein [Actinokineospora sp.]|uniref:hypothetical protein n=1 Tax=Actinokineospora sp. TaxID=1872133 RepID=UPI0040377435